MKQNKQVQFPGYLVAWGIQIAESLAAGFLAAASAGLPPVPSGLMLWGLTPVFGALTAFQAVRRGLLNYAAWIAPPACLYAAHYALWGYAPSAGAALLCALVSLVGAAAGEVYTRQK